MPPDPGRGRTDWESAAELLRRRGYLGGEDGPARRPATGFRAAVWLLALAAAFAVAVAAGGTAPLSVSGLLWTAGLLLVPAAAALAVTVAVFTWALERWHRAGLEARRASAVAGAASAVTAVAAWLALTLGSPVPTSSAQRLAAALLALAAAAGIARFAGHRLAARILRRAPGPEVRAAGWALASAAAAAVLAAGLALHPARSEAPHEAPPLALRPHRAHLAVLGVDGLPLDDLRLVAGTTVPEIARWGHAPLAAEAAGATLPVAWVTVATGVPPEVHGVTGVRQLRFAAGGAEVLAAPGLRRLLEPWSRVGLLEARAVPAARRRVPTVWEMASAAGMGVTVAGWWGSFPVRRVTGLLASVRWVLAGDGGPASVYPPGAAAELPSVRGVTPLAMDRRAAGVALSADPAENDLVMAYLPGWWLQRRAAAGGPLTVARSLRPHAELVVRTAARLGAAGWTVWIVGLDGRGGGWVATSACRGGHRAVTATELAPTWLDALGLPVPAGAPAPRRDLSGTAAGEPVRRADYGPPPPLAGVPPAGEAAAQLELIETLGYLR